MRFLSCLLVGSVLACAAPSRPIDAPNLSAEVGVAERPTRDVLAAFEAASNAHDLDALSALLTEDASWFQGDVAVYRGRDEVLSPLAYDAATNAHFQLENLTFRGTSVRCEIVESNDFFRALGVESIRQNVEFETRGNRVQSLRSLKRKEVGPGERTVARFLQWLMSNRREDFARLMSNARPENAAELVEFARVWTANGQPD